MKEVSTNNQENIDLQNIFDQFIYHMQNNKDPKYKAASAINVTYEVWTDEKTKCKQRVEMYGPAIQFKECFDHIYFRICFQNERCPEYKQLLRLLCKYENDLDQFLSNDNVNERPVCFMTILPMHYHGNYYMGAVTPLMWRNYSNGKGKNCFIEFLYTEQSICIYETDQIDEKKIEADIKREAETKAYMEFKILEKKQYEEERENARRNYK